MMPRSQSNYDAALAYSRRAWRIFPLPYPLEDGSCSCGRQHDNPKDIGKHPTLIDWVSRATYDEATVKAWWTEEPLANIGLVTGITSGIFVLDVDGEAGEVSLAKLESLYSKLPVTYEVETGRGRHLYFLYPVECEQDGRVIINSAGKLGPSLDIRGQGGYVVAPPSKHGLGKTYTITPGKAALPASAPEWFVELLVGKTPHKRDARLTPKQIPEGQRDSELTRLAGKLRWHGFDEPTIYAALVSENNLKCKPPLEDKDLRRIASSIARYDPAKFSAEGRNEPQDALIVRAASQITEKPVTWRWHRYLPFGALSVWAGDPGQGKSTAAYALAALVTRGLPMPFVNGDHEVFAPANVVILSGEDSAEHVVVPRLAVCGADLDRVKILSPLTQLGKTLGLPDHLPQFRALIEQVKPQLIIVDPLNAFIGLEIDSHKDAELRHGVLQPLANIAEESGAAVLAISHMNKTMTQAMYRLGGSVALVAAPRTVFVFAEMDPEEKPGEYVFVCLKNNYSRKPPALNYIMEEVVRPGIGPVSRIRWVTESGTSAAQALSVAQPEDRGQRGSAKQLLHDMLEKGPQLVKDIEREARAAGISIRTLDRSRADLGIKPKRQEGKWYLSLPNHIWQKPLLDDKEL